MTPPPSGAHPSTSPSESRSSSNTVPPARREPRSSLVAAWDDARSTDSFGDAMKKIKDCLRAEDLPITVRSYIVDALSDVQDEYIMVLEENRSLRKALDEKQQGSLHSGGRTFKEALMMKYDAPKMKAMDNAPIVRDLMISVKKSGNQPASEEAIRKSLDTIKGKIETKIIESRLPISRIIRRSNDVAVFYPPTTSTDDLVALINRITGVSAKSPEKLLPEILVYTGDHDSKNEEEVRRQAKSYAPELHIDDWTKVRSTDKFTVYRVPMEDRNVVIKNRGIYTKAQRLRAHDYLNIRGSD
ncbi:hypothetical protein FOZ63_032649 [Perkinsus olseni]|uniref:Uncharacterized protein n=1 Tax=Perkinsus olseni TaxID=32597 RepID=A0A7J6UC20_PEROL|nr:hypothetical protein FOZ60_007099 [Perkinsus olseni]KAF4705054.1 hypothetical protein FOZ62_011078 [Perkinsus olseni]KAF4754737.1 hypothetical protein FOZ63_032649 [Perkinsus olseni]